ncbi:RNA-dependent RNA polymerase 1-like protein [Drosera capensis]
MGKTIQVSGFPRWVSAEDVKSYLERHTGQKSVHTLKLWPFKNGGPRMYAIVQFTTVEHADCIFSLAAASGRLWYGSSYLKVRRMDSDLVPNPRTYDHYFGDITLHFGCQISKEKFVSFWKVSGVCFDIMSRRRKLHFLVSLLDANYELELTYEDMWQVNLFRPRSGSLKYLVIQLVGAPRIYQKVAYCSVQSYEADMRVRRTDFTNSSSIGQSSTLCLELPLDFNVSCFKDNFPYYKENGGEFMLKAGIAFCRNSRLVPIIASPEGVSLPYEILFKISWLVQNGCLPGPTLDAGFFRVVDPHYISSRYIDYALEKLFYLKECCYDPVKWLREEYQKCLSSRRRIDTPSISLDAGLVYVRRVQVTPCRVYFSGPEVNVSNRVLRNYPDDIDNFLRVSFVDEDLEKLYSTDLHSRSIGVVRKKTEIYERIISTLKNGIFIGDKKFEFLAFSSSQLRENSLWLFARRPGLCAADIRGRMGDFSRIKNVAKYAARLGQSFSSSTETLIVYRHEMEVIPDVETMRGGVRYVFSDGIGKISADFAQRVAIKCGLRSIPSAYQIRYGGFKGVVAIDPTSSMKLSLRSSMCKFESAEMKLDVLSYTKYQPCYLNRQLITLLSTLGVKDFVFVKKQREAINQLDAVLVDPLKAQEALELMSPGENTHVLKEMLGCGYKPDTEPFLSMMLQIFRSSRLLELRIKSRIFIPSGRTLMGCLDETGTLEYGQVFVQVSDPGTKHISDGIITYGSNGVQPRNRIIKGRVVVAKNPCLHPGDVRALQAVDVPSLHHMLDCVVFPRKGKRPHPNECSGSDLDGDLYFVSWDPELVPPQQEEPMDYTSAEAMVLDHDVTIEEIQEYFTNYIVNDSLGIIANAHVVFADKDPGQARSDPCIQLAKLFSIAVDFPKTGIPAEIPQHLYVREYPDFMEKLDKPTYKSENVIGKLFREVKDRAPHRSPIESFTREVARGSYDPHMEYDGFEDFLDDASYYKSQYDYKLGNLMDYYGIGTEAEIISGNIMKMSKSFHRRKDAEAISMAVKSLKKEARTWFNKMGNDLPSGASSMYARASAWYYVTYHPSYWGSYNEDMNREHFLSFAWCVYDKLIQIKKDRLAIERFAELSLH